MAGTEGTAESEETEETEAEAETARGRVGVGPLDPALPLGVQDCAALPAERLEREEGEAGCFEEVPAEAAEGPPEALPSSCCREESEVRTELREEAVAREGEGGLIANRLPEETNRDEGGARRKGTEEPETVRLPQLSPSTDRGPSAMGHLASSGESRSRQRKGRDRTRKRRETPETGRRPWRQREEDSTTLDNEQTEFKREARQETLLCRRL